MLLVLYFARVYIAFDYETKQILRYQVQVKVNSYQF